jgi:hypothetical protein
MAQLGTVQASNTFLQWLSHANRAYQRLDAFASDDQALTANTINANVALNVIGTTSLTGSNTNIQGGSLLVTSNANFTENVQLQAGSLVIYTDTADPSSITLYCNDTNQHAIKLQAHQHANAIGAFSRTLTLPAANGTLLWGAANTTHQSVTTTFSIEGDLIVAGNTTTINASNLSLVDPLIKLASNNEVSDTVDIGFFGHYYDGSLHQHAGLFRDASDAGTFKLFSTYAIEANNALTIDTTDGSFGLGDLDIRNLDATSIVLNGTNLNNRFANTAQLANTNSYIATVASTERSALANTNTYIATMLPKAGGQMTGNITMAGAETVDGRDLSVDGTKLDGIEAGATADQTASEILTLIKTVDGTSSGLDADLLQGTSSTQFLRTDTASTKTVGDLSFADSVKAIFGAGSDLQIFHDGSNSYVQENGTGTLNIRGTNLALASSTGEYYLFGAADGSTTLYYDNALKLATISTGVTVTGHLNYNSSSGAVYTVTTSGGVTLDLNTYQNFEITLNGALTLNNPTINAENVGQSGVFVLIQDGSGNRTLSLGTSWETADAGGITLSTVANRKDIIPYYVKSTTEILLGRPTRNYS